MKIWRGVLTVFIVELGFELKKHDVRNSFDEKVDYDQGDEDDLQELKSLDQADGLLVLFVPYYRARLGQSGLFASYDLLIILVMEQCQHEADHKVQDADE